jgi:hypothetical protein
VSSPSGLLSPNEEVGDETFEEPDEKKEKELLRSLLDFSVLSLVVVRDVIDGVRPRVDGGGTVIDRGTGGVGEGSGLASRLDVDVERGRNAERFGTGGGDNSMGRAGTGGTSTDV